MRRSGGGGRSIHSACCSYQHRPYSSPNLPCVAKNKQLVCLTFSYSSPCSLSTTDSFPAAWLAQLCRAGGDPPLMQAKGQLSWVAARRSGSIMVHALKVKHYTFIIARYNHIRAQPTWLFVRRKWYAQKELKYILKRSQMLHKTCKSFAWMLA